jgi:MFS family permease
MGITDFPLIGLHLKKTGALTEAAISLLYSGAISDRVVKEKRAQAFGLFNTVFGLFWFIGSAIIGFLYDRGGPVPMVVFSVIVQGFSLFLFSTLIFGPRKATL